MRMLVSCRRDVGLCLWWHGEGEGGCDGVDVRRIVVVSLGRYIVVPPYSITEVKKTKKISRNATTIS